MKEKKIEVLEIEKRKASQRQSYKKEKLPKSNLIKKKSFLEANK